MGEAKIQSAPLTYDSTSLNPTKTTFTLATDSSGFDLYLAGTSGNSLISDGQAHAFAPDSKVTLKAVGSSIGQHEGTLTLTATPKATK